MYLTAPTENAAIYFHGASFIQNITRHLLKRVCRALSRQKAQGNVFVTSDKGVRGSLKTQPVIGRRESSHGGIRRGKPSTQLSQTMGAARCPGQLLGARVPETRREAASVHEAALWVKGTRKLASTEVTSMLFCKEPKGHTHSGHISAPASARVTD